MRGKCCSRKVTVKVLHPSLRRHYPDQVCGFNLSRLFFGSQHPGKRCKIPITGAPAKGGAKVAEYFYIFCNIIPAAPYNCI